MWAVTEYCPGGDLLKLIEQDKSLPEHIVKGFANEISMLWLLRTQELWWCATLNLRPSLLINTGMSSWEISDRRIHLWISCIVIRRRKKGRLVTWLLSYFRLIVSILSLVIFGL